MARSRSQLRMDAAAVYTLRYPYTIATAVDAGRFFQARTVNWLTLAGVAGLLVGAVVTAVYDGAMGFGIVGGSVGLLVLARFTLVDRLVGQWRFKHMLGAIMELRLKDDGIAFQGPIASGHIPWASITEIRANARTVLFVSHRLLAAYAPAAAFASAQEQDDVIAYSRSRIEAAKRGGDSASGG